MIPSFLLRPVCAVCILVAIGITAYLYCVHRDLHSHNRHLQELQERIHALEDIAQAPPTKGHPEVPVIFATAKDLPGDVEGDAQSVHSFSSDELRAMLDVIHEEAEEPHKDPVPQDAHVPAAPAADPDLGTCDADHVRHASYNALKVFLKSKDLSTRGTREALVERVLQYRETPHLRIDADHTAQ